jgi:hypothetical protein
MFNFKYFLARLLLAGAMLCACGQAAATPIYRVDIDTASLGTGPAFLNLYFLGLNGATGASATVSNLAGAFDGNSQLSGAVSGSAPGPFVFSNADGINELVQAIHLGGKFSFDVSFAMQSGSTGTTFGWALFDSVQYLGANGDLGNLFLEPGAPAGGQITFTTANSLSSVSMIPEPSTAALMLLGMLAALALPGKGGRRR